MFVPAKSCAVYKSPNESNNKDLQGTEFHPTCQKRFSPLTDLQDKESLDHTFVTLDYQNDHETEFPLNHPIVESRGSCTLQANANKQKQISRPSQDKYRGGIISKQYTPKGLRKIHKLERKQFTEKAPVQMYTKNSCIPIKLADSDYIALIDTGSDISTISEKILLQNDNLRRLPRFTSDISAATTAAENHSVFLNIQCFQR